MSVETLPLRVAEDSGDAGGAEPNGEMHVYGWRIYDRWRCEGKEEACVPLPRVRSFAGTLLAIRSASLPRPKGAEEAPLSAAIPLGYRRGYYRSEISRCLASCNRIVRSAPATPSPRGIFNSRKPIFYRYASGAFARTVVCPLGETPIRGAAMLLRISNVRVD